MKVFLISPVRAVSSIEQQGINDYVASLESQGIKVHMPIRDTNQVDDIGNNICSQNREAIANADEVHIYWNPSSQGSLFDIGMAWALHKPIKVVNDIESTPKKSFSNVILWWQAQC